ncbi:MAG: hypothetical protein KGJ79_18930 [Alphaproteobacteria bacterium]|nr:hypothetical protein [Alphaproteobacteria bacterium]MDE2494704.1 hypothetical protein [Alphaproteobacteria bacterium]
MKIAAAPAFGRARRLPHFHGDRAMTTDRIRQLNDVARTQPQIVNAAWVMTIGVQHLLAGDECKFARNNDPLRGVFRVQNRPL